MFSKDQLARDIKQKMALIEDIVSSGGAVLDALEKLSHDNVQPVAVACAMDRQLGGAEKLARTRLRLYSVLTMTEITQVDKDN